MKHKSRQNDFDWGEPEGFALVSSTTLDGERIARERNEQEENRRESEKKQMEMV